MRKRPNLPIGKSSFQNIRQNNDLYVDKTRHIFQMADSGDYYFLSRPRRFGKSLTISTLKCLFQGKKELFDGLWIARHTDWDWKAHPVVLIDFNEIPHHQPDIFRRSLSQYIQQTAEQHGIGVQTDFLETRFQELVTGLFNAYQRPVVVLVDEYDKPIISHLGRGKEALAISKQNRDILRYFFGVLKGGNVSPCLRFVFLTGVSKFSRVSLFSELNNLEDISMTDSYADMLGYTQSELERDFAPYIREMADKFGVSQGEMHQRLAEFYNGYRFSPEDIRVYNPYSVMSALKQKAFNHYWFETGTPAFLVDLIRESRRSIPKIEKMKATEIMFNSYELDDLKPEALLFQTGYVTIQSVEKPLYTFGYPNQEVKTAFLETLLHSYSKGLADQSRFALLADYLLEADLEAFIETASAIFADIPYRLESKRDEAYFHTLFYLMVSASGVNTRSEVLTCEGRIDMVVEFTDRVYVVEFKCNQNAETAIRQIKDKGYARKYRQGGKRITLLGINFDTKTRNISGWKAETSHCDPCPQI